MSSNGQYHSVQGGADCGGDDVDDDRSAQSSIGMATCDENFAADHRQFNDAIHGHGHGHGHDHGGGGTEDDENDEDDIDDGYRIEGTANDGDDDDDAATMEAMSAVTRERQLTLKENKRKLTSILASMKNSTKDILGEVDVYLQETADIEKTYIRCRANTQKERRRMERVEPDVIAATQRFIVAQGANMFGGEGRGCGNFSNMTSSLGGGGGGGGGGDSMEISSVSTARNNAAGDAASAAYARVGTVTPRGNDGASRVGSIEGSSMTGTAS